MEFQSSLSAVKNIKVEPGVALTEFVNENMRHELNDKHVSGGTYRYKTGSKNNVSLMSKADYSKMQGTRQFDNKSANMKLSKCWDNSSVMNSDSSPKLAMIAKRV